jgi:hypothetical protein
MNQRSLDFTDLGNGYQSLSDRVPLFSGAIFGNCWRIIKPRSGDCKYPHPVFVLACRVAPIGNRQLVTGKRQQERRIADPTFPPETIPVS